MSQFKNKKIDINKLEGKELKEYLDYVKQEFDQREYDNNSVNERIEEDTNKSKVPKLDVKSTQSQLKPSLSKSGLKTK